MRDDISIEWVTTQIVATVNKFEGKKLPDWAVGGIVDWCQTIDRLAAGSVTVALPDDQKTH